MLKSLFGIKSRKALHLRHEPSFVQLDPVPPAPDRNVRVQLHANALPPQQHALAPERLPTQADARPNRRPPAPQKQRSLSRMEDAEWIANNPQQGLTTTKALDRIQHNEIDRYIDSAVR